MRNIPFALQLYSVRDHIEKDLSGTLEKVKAMGYDHVETVGTQGIKPRKCMRLLESLSLTPVSAHIAYDDVVTNPKGAIKDAKALNLKYVVVPWIDPSSVASREAWTACGHLLNQAGARFRDAEMSLCYHNHDHEMVMYDGEYALDILFNEAEAGNLSAELDTYWIRYGGADPVAFIQKYAGRCPLLHIKDMDATEARGFAEVGRGVIDWAPIFDAGADAGVEWYIVEQDESTIGSLESAKISAEFMSAQ